MSELTKTITLYDDVTMCTGHVKAITTVLIADEQVNKVTSSTVNNLLEIISNHMDDINKRMDEFLDEARKVTK